MKQLICKYGTDPAQPSAGFVFADHEDGQAVDMSAYPGCVLIPYAGSIDDLKLFGPEPQKMGPAPTGIDPVTNRPYVDGRAVLDTRCHRAAPELTPVVLSAYAANIRYGIETRGIVVQSIPVATDRSSQAAIEKLASRAARDASYAPSFKGSDGKAYPLKSEQVVEIADGVDDHVQACRAMEDVVNGEIASGKISTLAQIDAAFKTV